MSRGRPKLWRGRVPQLVAAIGVAGIVMAAGGRLAAQEPVDVRALEHQITERLVSGSLLEGEVPHDLFDRYRALQLPRRTVRLDRSAAVNELELAIAHFELAVAAEISRRSEPTANARALDRRDLAPLLSAYDRLVAADERMMERFSLVRALLEEAGVGEAILSRAEVAEAQYRTFRSRLLTPLAQPLAALRRADDDEPASPESPAGRVSPGGPQSVAEAVRATADALQPTANVLAELPTEPLIVLRTGLPYRRAELPQRPLLLEPTVVPSYLKSAEEEPTAADLAGDPAAPLDEAILDQATALGFDAVRIFELVRNTIATEWYAGSAKGARATLEQGRGNDVDQASLLVALLRASQVPARYVRGVIELPLAAIAESLALDVSDVVPDALPDAVPEALAKAGVAFRPVIRGGRIDAVEVEHTWVSAYVPYSNYRGAVVDFSGRTWVPLVPAIKGMANVQPTGILREVLPSAADRVDAYLATSQPHGLLRQIRTDVEGFLAQQGLGATLAEQLGSEAIVEETLGLLPSSLPMTVVAVTAEEAELDTGLEHRLRLVLGAGATQSPLLDATFPLSELAGRRLTLSYLPATADDHLTVNTFGGLYNTPAFLIELRPQIRVDGRREVVGQAGVPAGALVELALELQGPGRTEQVEQTILAGGYYAIAIGAPRVGTAPTVDDVPFGDEESDGARLLAQTAVGFAQRWDAAEDELARLLGIDLVRPSPSLVIAGLAMGIDQAFGLPQQLLIEGITLDAALRMAEPLVGADGDVAVNWMRLAALEGSSLERLFFEDVFLVDSISADRALGLARDAGIQVHTIDAANVGTVLPALEHPPTVIDEIDNWVRLGMTVEVPQSPITLNAWSGSAWRVEEPASGAAGYFLAGGLAGGATTQSIDNWALQFVAESLQSIAGDAPNDDPLSGVTITKIPATDNQDGEVDRRLPKSLAVLVRDEIGRPVRGAEVQFSVVQGGGTLGSGAVETSSVQVFTNALGLASVPLRLGKHTHVNPALRKRKPSDTHPSQVSGQIVEAVAASASGPLVLDTPFVAFAFPGTPETLRRLSSFDPMATHTIGRHADTIEAAVEDRFGNPVANVPVLFEVGPFPPEPNCPNAGPAPPPGGSNDPSFSLNATVFDFTDDDCGVSDRLPHLCGGPSRTVLTHDKVAPVGVILGNVATVTYTVSVSVPSEPELVPLQYDYAPEPFERRDGWANGVFHEGENGLCVHDLDYLISSVNPIDENGNLVAASRPGQEYPTDIEVALFYFERAFEVQQIPGTGVLTRVPLTNGRWVPTVGTVLFEVTNGGTANPQRIGITDEVIFGELSDGTPIGRSAGNQTCFPSVLAEGFHPERDESCYESAHAPEIYRTKVTPGPTPGQNDLIVRIASIEAARDVLDNVGGELVTRQILQRFDVLPGEPAVIPLDLPTEKVTHVWGVEPLITDISPSEIALTPTGRAATPIDVNYRIDPPEYRALSVEVALLENGKRALSGVGSSRQGTGEFVFQRGVPFDKDKSNELALVLNRSIGTVSLVSGQPVILPIAQQLFRNLDPFVRLSQDIDLLNERVCTQAEPLRFGLTREAEVTIVMRRIDGLNVDGSPAFGTATTIVNGEILPEGEHARLILPSELLPGEYRVEYRGVATVDGEVETRETTAQVAFSTSDNLPIGHAMVNGVDLWNGHLVVSREDLSYPGRGPALSLRRTFSSGHGDALGPLGVGWSHSYDSRVVVTPCGEVIVIGAEGSGMRFVDDGQGGLRPLIGHHGTLVANSEAGGFDFFTKNGTLYRYRITPQGDFKLDSIADPNGNTTVLTYETRGTERLLTAVRDSAGRELRFTWDERIFAFSAGHVVVGVTGPGDLSVSYDYDGLGNLVRATREGSIRSERYEYGTGSFEGRHMLVAVENELNGARTAYAYGNGVIGVQGGVQVPSFFVSSLTEPEGGTSQFTYSLADLASRATPTLTTTVIDGRNQTTTYTLNQYGSPLAIVDPLNNRTEMTWAADDIVMESRTDANLVRTDFTYDANGNVLTETVPVTDFDGTINTYVLTNTWWPEPCAAGPFGCVSASQLGALVPLQRPIKTLLRTRQDRNGHTTELYYDPRGNLTEQRITVGNVDGVATDVVTTHSYFANGDRALTTDPRGHATSFTYDAFGNLETMTDPLGGVTTTEWNERSLPRNQTDAEGRTTSFTYDSLGRLLRTLLPAAGIQVAEEIISYDDVANLKTETDPEGRVTVTRFDLQGRVTRIDNAEVGQKHFAYDAEGNKTLESTWFDVGTPRLDTTFLYDAAGRLSRRDEPEGRVTIFAYDGVGNVTQETLQQGANVSTARITTFAYDGLNRQIRVARQFEGGEALVQSKFDGEGNKVLDVDPLGRPMALEYDGLHRLLRTTEPEWRMGEPKVTERLYDGNGNLVEERQLNERLTASGEWLSADQIRRFEYDELDRPVARIDAEGNTSTFEYDRVGNLTREVDARAHVTNHTYDERNRRTTTTQLVTLVRNGPLIDVVTAFEYDRVGNVVEERLPSGNVISHTHDGLNRLLESTDLLGLVQRFAYDARGNRTLEVDANGNQTTLIYDGLDRLVERRLPEQRVESFGYDVAGNVVSETDPNLNSRTHAYDKLNRRIQTTFPQVTTPSGPETYTLSMGYDLVGNRTSETDRRGNVRSFEYDALNRLVRIEDPVPFLFAMTFTFDAVGNKVSERDRRGIEELIVYDRENRLTEQSRAGLLLQGVEYDQVGNKRFETDANGHVTGFEYDERDLLIATNRPQTSITRLERNAAGDVVRETDPETRVVVRTYDVRRRLRTETNHAAETTTFGYDGNGNRTAVERPKSNSWQFQYDGADRLVKVIDPLFAETTYGYDKNGNRLSQTDAELRATSFEYDELDRMVAKVYPDLSREEQSFDPNDNVVSVQDPKGQIVLSTYDELDRETLRTYPPPTVPTGNDLASIGRSYDENGNLVQVDEVYGPITGTRTTLRTYDDFDRLETVTDPQGKTLTYRYDPNGNRSRLTDPDGLVTGYVYDGLNRITTVTNAGGVTEYRYFRDSRLKDVRYPNGVEVAQTYDDAGRLLTIDNTLGQAVVSSYAYEYDPNGNRTRQTEVNGGAAEETTYGYDLADRLLEVTYPDKRTTYTYDLVGNRLTEQDVDVVGGVTVLLDRTYSYDNRDRLLSVDDLLDPTQTITYGYDANGNQTSKTKGGVLTDFLYDVRDQVTEVRNDGVLLTSHLYDYQGLRVRKSGPGGVVRYVYDDQSVLLQTEDAGLTLAKYDYGPDRLLSIDHATEGRQFYLFDGLGSVVDLTLPDGTIQARYQYDAWGNPRSTVGGSFNPFRFTSHERDGETGLYYAKARFYDPEVGRFLSEDPVEGMADDPPSLHRYTYAKVNPTVFVDPAGLVAVAPSEQHTLGQELERLQAQIDEAQAALDAALEKTSNPQSVQSLFEAAGRAKLAYEAAKRRFDEGEVFFAKVASFLAENQGEVGVEALARFIASEENVSFSRRAVDIAGELLGAEPCVSANCQFQQGFRGSRDTAHLLNEFVVFTSTIFIEEIAAVGLVDDVLRGSSLGEEIVRLADKANASKQASRRQRQTGNVKGAEVPRTAGLRTQHEFERATAGKFASRSEAALGWKAYQESNRANKTLVIGRLPDTEAAELAGFQRLNIEAWTPAVNDAWIQGAIDARRPIKLVSPINLSNLLNPSGSRFRYTVFLRELRQLLDADYIIRDGWALPPGP